MAHRAWRGNRPLGVTIVAVAVSLFAVRAAFAQTVFGELSNFDVFNDTGEETHGFEIELDGIASGDVSFTFGSPYQRYGDPSVVEFAGGVYVRYESPYDPVAQTFTATTPRAPSVITPTLGHACWTGGSADYLTSGCEHFGVGLNRSATATIYRWLVADPMTPGALQPSGTKVSIPAPTWTVSQPQPGAAPVVRAVLPAEPPEINQEYGDAMWVKVFVTEAAEPIELHHLVTDDPAVPSEPAETEIEWILLQAGPPGKGNGEIDSQRELGAGNQSVTRRYEFYAYTGPYDPESHEALCSGGHGCETPGPGDLGNYLGAQMGAVNVEPALPTPTDTPFAGATATATETATATPSPTAAAVCDGDCNGDRAVTINELIALVDVALGLAPASQCASGIPDGATVDIAFLVRAVGHALAGHCT
jgi:hypothetical protein